MNVTEVKTPKVTINLEGKDYELKFTLSSMAELEEEYGSIDEALKMMENRSIRVIRFFLWAGIMHEDETLTPKKVGDMISFSQLTECAEALGRAMSVSMPASTGAVKKSNKGASPNK